jgi:hypothetical protein
MKTSSLFVAGLLSQYCQLHRRTPEKKENNKRPASYADCTALARKQGWGYNATWAYCQEYKN